MPLFSASSTPSLKASICTARLKFVAIFIETARPLGPTCVTLGPIASRIGRARSADRDGKLAFLERRDAAGDRRVEHRRALLLDFRRQRAASRRAYRAHV